MSRSRAGIIGAALILAGCQAQAAQSRPPEGLVAYVLTVINADAVDAEDPISAPPLETTVPEGVISPVDISADGVTDWRIDWPQSQAVCGTGGCQRTLYISAGDHFVRAFDRQAFELTLRRVGGETRLEAWVHDVYCRVPSADCRFTWRWDAASEALLPLPDQPGDALAPVDPDFRGETPR